MSDERKLAELLRTTARTTGQAPRPDPILLISRARHVRQRRRLTALVGVAVVALIGVALVVPGRHGGDRGVDLAAGAADGFPPGWTRLPDAPLSPRVDATVAAVGDEVVVVGGHHCPAAMDCVASPALDDGAAFELTSKRWHAIPPLPLLPMVPFSRLPATVVDGAMYLLAPCSLGPCASPLVLLRYRPGQPAWDVLPGPPGAASQYALVRLGSGLVAYSTSTGRGEPELRFDLASGSWSELPKNPLPQVLRRQMVAVGADALLFGTVDGRTSVSATPLAGARLDAATGTWSSLPTTPHAADSVQAVEGVIVAEGGFELACCTFDVATGSWTSLPPHPPEATKLVGALGEASASFSSSSGWVVDLATRTWVPLPPPEDRAALDQENITSVGRRLFRFGGARGSELVNDAWVWTPRAPAAPADPTGLAAPTAPSPPPSAPPPSPPPAAGPLPPLVSAPVPPGAPGAPRFVSATADATASRITIRFDRPVVAGSNETGPNGNNAPKSVLAAMSLIVFGSDSRCSIPQGNAHEYLSGVGTDTITTDATSLAAGTTYISISSGFVKSAADGTPNDPVETKGPAGIFGSSCIPVAASGTVPTTPITTEPVGGPELLTATGDGAAGRMTLHFNRPVVPGDGSAFDGGPRPPTSGDPMPAMNLVVHMTDSTCSHPNGNAHQYLAGVGTDTLTVDATSLVVGTTYVSITPGFAKGAADGKAMRWVHCLAVTVTG